MKCAHLFNGIGGFALGAHWMGWENYMHCEIDSFCNRVMNHHFPKSIQHEDIRTTDFSIYRGKIDLLTGGFPCQPYSISGKRLGKADARHLWPEKRRAVREIQPTWVVPENVRGLINWNDGLVFDEVCTDLEAEGYQVLPFLLPAAGVNAPHRRDRVFIVAYSDRYRINRRTSNSDLQTKIEQERYEVERETTGPGEQRIITDPNIDGYGRDNGSGEAGREKETTEGAEQREGWEIPHRERVRADIGGVGTEGNATNSCSQGLEGGFQSGGRGLYEPPGSQPGCELGGTYPKTDWGQFPTVSPVCKRNDGLSLGLARISVPGKSGRRLLSPVQSYGRWRKESIKALGNAIVPQVALQIFKAIAVYEQSQ